MKTNVLYIAAAECGSGSLLISLGFMEMLFAQYSRIAFFKPVIASHAAEDEDILFMQKQFSLEASYTSMTLFDLSEINTYLSVDDDNSIYESIIDRIKHLESEFDVIICSGLESERFGMIDFDINAMIASNINALYVPIINAKDKAYSQIEKALQHAQTYYERAYNGKTLATFVNRLSTNDFTELTKKAYQSQVYFLPEEEELALPTISDLIQSLNCRVVHGKEDDFKRVIKGTKVGSMEIENFILYLEEGDLVVMSGDRADLILASIASMYSSNFPHISGILLTGNLVPSAALMKMLEGLSYYSIPILSLPYDTYNCAMKVSTVHSRIRPNSERKIALAMGLFNKHVSDKALLEMLHTAESSIMTPTMFEYLLMDMARKDKKRIVLPESTDERILRAAEILLRREVVNIILLGDAAKVHKITKNLGLDLSKAVIIDPKTSPKLKSYTERFYQMRKAKGLGYDAARDALTHENYFATMMVELGDADGMVSGAIHTTSDTIRPALQIIKTRPGISLVSSCFFMCMKTEVLVYGDCAINQNPNAIQLSEIALASSQTAAQFGIEPRVAMLSYSTGSSGHGDEVEKVKAATEALQKNAPQLLVEGPIQYDAAVDQKVAQSKMPGSKVAGRATVFIFPDLNTGNNTYKAVQRSSNAVAIGPILQGLNKPVNDLSRGCLVDDIINTVAVTAIQAQLS